jgi:catechol-2,3-dioxygenase
LDGKNIPYSDYGTAFAKEWHQVFFHDPEGNVIEVHQAVA